MISRRSSLAFTSF